MFLELAGLLAFIAIILLYADARIGRDKSTSTSGTFSQTQSQTLDPPTQTQTQTQTFTDDDDRVQTDQEANPRSPQ